MEALGLSFKPSIFEVKDIHIFAVTKWLLFIYLKFEHKLDALAIH